MAQETKLKGEATIRLGGVKNGRMPVAICIEGPDGRALPLIEEGARVPKTYRNVFTPTGSYQMSAYLHLVLGNRPWVADCRDLCTVRHDEGSFQMAGRARYQLTVKVTSGGRVTVSTANLDAKGRTGEISLPAGEVAASEVAALVADARAHAEDDARSRERYEMMSGLVEKLGAIHDEQWPMAKRKMTFGEKRGYKQCRKKMLDLLKQGPTNIDDAQMGTLADLDVEMDSWQAVIAQRADQVAAWYK